MDADPGGFGGNHAHDSPEDIQQWLSIDCEAQQPALIELDLIAIQQIAAPTGDEGERAAWVADCAAPLRLHGREVTIDACTTSMPALPGAARAPALLVSAHTDTVFPAGTDLAVRHADAQIAASMGPGWATTPWGWPPCSGWPNALRHPPPPVDIWFVANTGEEGNGNLRGMRAAVDRLQAGGRTPSSSKGWGCRAWCIKRWPRGVIAST